MEKITKKKKAKGFKKRIGLIAVGGLSLVLTICLSVGATLAWFAGSTWSSKSLFMGGPVYVEMAGRGIAGSTAGAGANEAKWQGGAGNLDIRATAARSTGTVTGDGTTGGPNEEGMNKILLPGQKYEIYSQARVFSTAYTTTDGTNSATSNNSGSNVTNTSASGTAHITSKGRTTTTTTSVLRARFSIGIEFDPYMGFNNFKDTTYAANYPVQSAQYTGDSVTSTDPITIGQTALGWEAALGATSFNDGLGGSTTNTVGARRDAVNGAIAAGFTANTTELSELQAIKNGTKKSIYAWKFVSKATYNAIDDANPTTMEKMAAPFDGQTLINGVGYYGVWILDGSGNKTESNSFYKERTNSYLQSYVEEYITEYGGLTNRTIGESLKNFETELNDSFIDLINDSSVAIHAGKVTGMTINDGIMTYNSAVEGINASWLYVDPTIGNDTNTQELSTSAGGWWYLVETSGGTDIKAETITTETDVVTGGTGSEGSGEGIYGANVTSAPTVGTGFSRYEANNRGTNDFYSTTNNGAADPNILTAKLYEINPLNALAESFGTNASVNDVTKVVSYSFPFVNGTNVLPSKELTNVFANAKLTFQISFQALQAFFPYSTTIDGLSYTDSLLGTAKALNIQNAIPIYNEAFEY